MNEGISIERYYKAWSEFDAIVNAPENIVRVEMQPGDCVIFSNSRVMHGREEYTPGAGRHIQGCYIDHDAVRSHVDWATFASGADESTAENSECSNSSACGSGDVHSMVADQMLAALATQGDFSYGEGIDMLQHALQAAKCAEVEGESREAILSALFHDVGNSPQARAEWVAQGNPEVRGDAHTVHLTLRTVSRGAAPLRCLCTKGLYRCPTSTAGMLPDTRLC